jgi:hypothetical protein
MYILTALALVAVLWVLFAPGGAEKAEEMYQGIRGRFKFRNDTRELAGQFKRWVADTPTSRRTEQIGALPASVEGFSRWLGTLSDKDLEQFTQRVAHFCAGLKFDLAWLNSPEVSREPELKKAVEDTVLLYSLATWRAHTVEADVKAFLAYQAWLANPGRHKKFGQQLHRALVQRGLLVVPADLYLASDKERQEQARAAIIALSDANHAVFSEVLRQLDASGNAESDAAKAAAAPAPAPASAPPAAKVPVAKPVVQPQTTPA